MKRVLCILISVLILSVTVFTGCSESDSETSVDENNGSSESGDSSVFTIGIDGEPPSFDPKDSNSSRATLTVYNVYDTLLRFGEDETLEPCLASSWEMVDEVTYVYQIRDDVVFSDGSPMTMEDVLFSLNRIKDPDTAASMSYLFNSVDSFEQTGEYELTVNLSYPDATFKFVPATSTFQIISKSFYEENEERYGKPDGACMGTGAYKFESWQSGSEIVLTKNENWWGDPEEQLWDTVVYQVIEDSTARALAASTGQVEYVHNLTPDSYEIYEQSDNLNVYSYPSTQSQFVAFNTAKAPFDDPYVRKACAYLLDKEAITSAIGGKYATVSGGVPFGEAMFYMDEEAWQEANENIIEDYSYDLEKAQEMLALSNYPDGFECEMYTSASLVALSEIVQYQLSLIGIDVKIVEYSASESFEINYGYRLDENGDRPYDILATGWLSDYLDPIGYLVPYWASSSIYPGGANKAVYSNPELDDLIDQIYAEPDDAARAALEIEAYRIAAEDAPYVTLYSQDTTYAVSKEYELIENASWFWNFRLTDFKRAE